MTQVQILKQEREDAKAKKQVSSSPFQHMKLKLNSSYLNQPGNFLEQS